VTGEFVLTDGHGVSRRARVDDDPAARKLRPPMSGHLRARKPEERTIAG
jgi:hypothetical protein